MTTPEGKVKKEIKKVLDDLGACYFMPVSTGYGRAGVSDFIVCLNGRFVAIEAKAKGGKLTENQIKFLKGVDKAGGGAFVMWPDQVGYVRAGEAYEITVHSPDRPYVFLRTVLSAWTAK